MSSVKFRPTLTLHRSRGRYFIVTGTGKYFKNVYDDPENNLGIMRVSADGSEVELLWGYADGGRPTSELGPRISAAIFPVCRLTRNTALCCTPIAPTLSR